MTIRLDKFLCDNTELTRSLAKSEIARGEIKVDGIMVKNAAYKVTDAHRIERHGKPVRWIGFRYIMLNKPPGYICSTEDEVYPSVIKLIEVEQPHKLHIVGRLDVDTTGLVLITDDGPWSHAITSPKKSCGKCYRVQLANTLLPQSAELIEQGILLKGEIKPTLPAKLQQLSETEVLLTIFEGRYHQVKRLFAAVGNRVTQLHRQRIGNIQLPPSLKEGEWRHLSRQEISVVR